MMESALEKLEEAGREQSKGEKDLKAGENSVSVRNWLRVQ